MKLLFVNGSQVRFTVETPLREPLGGTESAVAYLSQALAARGHDVTLMANLPDGTADTAGGVRHRPRALARDADFFARAGFDAVVTISAPSAAAHMKRIAPGAFHVAWLHLPPNAQAAAAITAAAPAIDCALFVSATQRSALRYPGPSHVIGNGISPAFENLFSSPAQLRAAKQNRAAYASIPDRGLEVLADVIARARVETRFDIWSGMRLYQQAEDAFAPLYARLAALPRCRHHGAVGQADLARALAPCAFLAYPCTVGETYGIVVQEAIAAGLKVVTTDIGALKHTTMGFADLVPPGAELAARFSGRLEDTVAEFLRDPDAWAQARFDQMQAVNRTCTWAARAQEWEAFLAAR